MDRSLDEIIGERPARGVSARFRLPTPGSLLQLANRHHSAAEAEEAGHEDAATATVASDVQAHHPPERHGEKSIHEMVYERYVADEAIDEQGRSCDFRICGLIFPSPGAPSSSPTCMTIVSTEPSSDSATHERDHRLPIYPTHPQS